MEPAQSEMSILGCSTNGKGHNLGDDKYVPMKTLPEELDTNGTQNARFDDPDGILESEEFLPNGDGTKPMRFTDFEGKTSFGMSVFNLGNAIMGSGILGLAYAMANTGILLFLFLLTVVAVLSCYSIHLLLKSSGIVGIRAYEQLGYRAFGTPGKMAAGIAITLQNIGAMSSYLYIVKSEFPLVIQAFSRADPTADLWYLNGNYLVVMVSIGVILPLALMKQLGYLGYTSGFSLSCMVFFLSAVRLQTSSHCQLRLFSANLTCVNICCDTAPDHDGPYTSNSIPLQSTCLGLTLIHSINPNPTITPDGTNPWHFLPVLSGPATVGLCP
ncbi:unnamed protein product [Oncorhynchus mykiss]|uniref:Amino acid transporter transmembrane domain-containing protein n=1 Tax=Oncorhynchus mykiss TaxID=8022 RepID=A0A060VZY1_ONCMY|nr:unnamed protein product [Oncorhynchus mykiss]